MPWQTQSTILSVQHPPSIDCLAFSGVEQSFLSVKKLKFKNYYVPVAAANKHNLSMNNSKKKCSNSFCYYKIRLGLFLGAQLMPHANPAGSSLAAQGITQIKQKRRKLSSFVTNV